MAQRLLITGGTGFFGRALLRHFHSQSQLDPIGRPHQYKEIIVLSRNPQAFASRYPDLAQATWLRWASADIVQSRTLESLGIDEPIDAVLHAATDSADASAVSPAEKLDQIVDGTRNVLDLAVRLKAKRFLLTSSGGAYGPQPADMLQLKEDHLGMPDPLKMSSTYGVGKRLAEHLCFLYGESHGLETVIARCFAFVGQDLPMDAHFAIGNFIRDALLNSSLSVNGDGSPIRTYMDQRDLSCWLMALLEHGKAGQAYNVGSEFEISIRDLAHLVGKTLAPHKPVRVTHALASSGIRNRYVPSTLKARSELHLEQQYSLTESIIAAAQGFARTNQKG